MDSRHFREWFHKKIEMANAIVKAYGTEGEADAEILLCCATSALASKMWPGEGKDRKRFVEFLVQFSDPGLSLRKISIPLLERRLEKKGDLNTSIRVRRHFLPFMPVILDGESDKEEQDVSIAFPSLQSEEIRSCSYAAAIYLDLRCALIHEYRLSPHLVPFAHSDRTDIPSYLNLQDGVPDPVTGTFVSGETRRYLYFPYQYLVRILASSAESAFAYWDTCASWDQPEPQPWWIEG